MRAPRNSTDRKGEHPIRIRGIRRLDETLGTTGGSGDNWHTTWASDDRQYTSMGDGDGWPAIVGHTGKPCNTRVFAVIGNPPKPVFEHLPGFPDLHGGSRYYGFGIIAIDGHIYNYLSTPNTAFDGPQPRFTGAKLIWSPDNGKCWKNQDGAPASWEEWDKRSRGTMMFFNEPDDAFSLLTVLQRGKNYEHDKDGFVYLYSPNGNSEGKMNELVMCRVPKEKMLDRSSHEFFVKRNTDGTVQWSKGISDKRAVHTFPLGWVNTRIHPYAWHPSVAYNPGLGVYMMLNWGMGCASDGMWFGKPSYLGFWTAEHPWGPWEQVHEEIAWTPRADSNARCYQPQIAPKWIAADGKSFWMLYTDFQVINGKRPYYCFNYQKVEILT